MAHFGGNSDNDGPNIDLNLVPFIDLMCVCITFLMITAVWSQVSMVKLGSSIMGQKSQDQVAVLKKDIIPLRVDIKPEGYRVTHGLNITNVPKVKENYDDTKLLEQLKVIKEKMPEKSDAIVSISDDLSYKILIAGMDTMILAGFKDIGIAVGEVK